jgi:hypothetical protein
MSASKRGVSVALFLAIGCGAPKNPRPQRAAPSPASDEKRGLLAKFSSPQIEGKSTSLAELTSPDDAAKNDKKPSGHEFSYLNPRITLYSPPYTPKPVENPGRIEGRVLLPGRRKNAAPRQRCDDTPSRAVVYLADIESGRALLADSSALGSSVSSFQIGGSIARHDCRWSPTIQLVSPPGIPVEVVSYVDRRLELRYASRTGSESEHHPVLSGHGGRATIRALAVGPNYVRESNKPPEAWFFAAHHPYHALTDDDGRFSLEGIPSGHYELHVWMPPQARFENDRVLFDRSPLVRKKVQVKASRTTRLELRF